MPSATRTSSLSPGSIPSSRRASLGTTIWCLVLTLTLSMMWNAKRFWRQRLLQAEPAGYWFPLSGTGLAWMVEGDAAAVLAVLPLAALPLVEREVDELSLTIREPAEGQHHVPLVVGRQIKFGAIGQCTTIVGSAVVRQDRFFHQLDR